LGVLVFIGRCRRFLGVGKPVAELSRTECAVGVEFVVIVGIVMSNHPFKVGFGWPFPGRTRFLSRYTITVPIQPPILMIFSYLWPQFTSFCGLMQFIHSEFPLRGAVVPFLSGPSLPLGSLFFIFLPPGRSTAVLLLFPQTCRSPRMLLG